MGFPRIWRPALAVAAAALALGSAAACADGAVAATHRGHARYSAGAVRRAFAAVRDPLVDTGFGAFGSPVTVLTTRKTADAWSATAYVYPTAPQARASYRADLPGWRSSGIASTLLRNVVVVGGGGKRHGRDAGKAALPAPAAKALARLRAGTRKR